MAQNKNGVFTVLFASGFALSCFLRLHEGYEYDCSAFVILFKNFIFTRKTEIQAQLGTQVSTGNEIENVHFAPEVQKKNLKKACVMNKRLCSEKAIQT